MELDFEIWNPKIELGFEVWNPKWNLNLKSEIQDGIGF